VRVNSHTKYAGFRNNFTHYHFTVESMEFASPPRDTAVSPALLDAAARAMDSPGYGAGAPSTASSSAAAAAEPVALPRKQLYKRRAPAATATEGMAAASEQPPAPRELNATHAAMLGELGWARTPGFPWVSSSVGVCLLMQHMCFSAVARPGHVSRRLRGG
jgi:hypothetical protein